MKSHKKTKIEVALGNRAGAAYALGNAKKCSKGDFTALAAGNDS